MDVVIPAAGESNRLRPLTKDFPKTLLPVGEEKIIRTIIDACLANGLRNFHVLVGHGAQHVQAYCESMAQENSEISFHFIPVPEYATKGNIWSVFQAAHLFDRDVLLVNSDTLVHPHIIKALIESPEPHALAVDDFKSLGEEEMKVIVEDGRIAKIHKSLNPDTAHGEYIGALKISAGIKEQLVKAFEEMLAENPKLYYEDALQRAFDAGVRFGMVSTNGLPNMEIDTHEDLKNAEPIAEAIRKDLWE